MKLKQFKDFKHTRKVIEKYETSNGLIIEMTKTSSGPYAVCINDFEVECFKTLDAATEAVKDTIDAIESDEE